MDARAENEVRVGHGQPLPPLTFVMPRVSTWASSVGRVKQACHSSGARGVHAGERVHSYYRWHQQENADILVVASGGRRARGIFARPVASHAPAVVPATEIASAAVAVVLPPQGCEPLLLGVCVYVGADDETDNVEEGHPGVLWEELLGKGQGDGRDDPAHLHDGHETGLDGGPDLVEGACASNDGHRNEVYRVLDGGDLDV